MRTGLKGWLIKCGAVAALPHVVGLPNGGAGEDSPPPTPESALGFFFEVPRRVILSPSPCVSARSKWRDCLPFPTARPFKRGTARAGSKRSTSPGDCDPGVASGDSSWRERGRTTAEALPTIPGRHFDRGPRCAPWTECSDGGLGRRFAKAAQAVLDNNDGAVHYKAEVERTEAHEIWPLMS